jgi:hypothetical protein
MAGHIANTVCKAIPVHNESQGTPLPKKVVIYDATEIAGLLNYQAFVMQLKFVNDVFRDRVRPPLVNAIRVAETEAGIPHAAEAEALPAELIPGLVEGGIKSVIDIIGLFRTDTSITGKDFSPDDAALIAATAAALKTQGCTVYEPSVEPINLFDTSSSLVTNLTTLREAIVGLQMRVAAVKGRLQQQSDLLNAILQAQSALDALKKSIDQETDATKKQALQKQVPAAEQAVRDAITTFNALGAPGSPVTTASQSTDSEDQERCRIEGPRPGHHSACQHHAVAGRTTDCTVQG